ncbi:MAG: hypothetical protein M1434_03200 [Chloroflexi bacterium]|nr:hypothetical protein [Chloroflexota bacterium]MCL5273736.1 hypothetical protein [Chloroflexota bacterium]
MTQTLDLARAQYRHKWLHHFAIGDPSWDTFVREPGNPIYTGRPPYEWPVNGFLFRDPPAGRWLAYIGLYPRGYWPAGPCLTLRERTGGGWDEAGLAVQGDAMTFDGDGTRAGATPDVSIVYAGGRYHMVYDWASPDNARGGIAYAWAEQPEGPFQRAATPIHEDTRQSPLLGIYVRAYAPTLIQRQNDWIILHAMSTAGNAGGSWAMACMASSAPDGPYTSPTLLLYPQSDRYLPPLMEYYPAFTHAGYVYAPATSVALNRTFQCLFRAPLELAHNPEAWELYQHGSMWHAIDLPSEAQGLWGQTFSAQVNPNGVMRAYYTSKTRDDIGTVHLAQRPWDQPYHDGFVLSAPNTGAYGIVRQHYRTFRLKMSVAAAGNWSICWGCQAPLGPDRVTANAGTHPLMHPHKIQWDRSGNDWKLQTLDETGESSRQNGFFPHPAEGNEQVEITQDEFSATVELNGQLICVVAYPAQCGRLQLIAEQGAILQVHQFELAGSSVQSSDSWLSTEALAGAAESADGRDWCYIENSDFRYGFGYLSHAAKARAKWNYLGGSFKLYSPRGPQYGCADVVVDGLRVAQINLRADTPQRSTIVLSHDLQDGYHAVALIARDDIIPCDTLEVRFTEPDSPRG